MSTKFLLPKLPLLEGEKNLPFWKQAVTDSLKDDTLTAGRREARVKSVEAEDQRDSTESSPTYFREPGDAY